MKIIAFYLPQFHEIPENNEWWGKGFTEWVNVKKAKPLFDGHEQPRVPLNGNYYNLLDDDVKIWQAKIAKEHGVYGFCYYHYWFNGRMVLEKPMEQMLRNPEVDMPFCICWANEPWTKAWVGGSEVILPQFYGEEKEWKEHYDYLSQFFHDSRYITEDGRPLMILYRPEVIPKLNEMLDYWQELARKDGFPGLSFGYQNLTFDKMVGKDDSRFDYNIEYQPSYATWDLNSQSALKASKLWAFLRTAKRKLKAFSEKKLGYDLQKQLANSYQKSDKKTFSYDEAWQAILRKKPENDKNVPGAFVNWDNTPRKGNDGSVSVGASPEKFETYLTEQIQHTRDVYHKDMIFLFAWNEWAEGGYIEPDEHNGYGYLEAISNALKKTGEFPW